LVQPDKPKDKFEVLDH
jgi:hypothetical protein